MSPLKSLLMSASQDHFEERNTWWDVRRPRKKKNHCCSILKKRCPKIDSQRPFSLQSPTRPDEKCFEDEGDPS